MKLIGKKCVACEGGIPPLKPEEVQKYMGQVNSEWKLVGIKIARQFKFTDFKQALAFVNKVGAIAEKEGHHPDIHIEKWNHVRIELYTHSINGLHENDFIVAAKIDKILSR
ncbi:4a-hydroxytetrahydrobiopterin dehydratase [Candidatus Micrarchaeota archaeon]|nr:4a-hydroxytetrahydrobiopterin dehydratase [Candidatus Micrarchaeota archaeon]